MSYCDFEALERTPLERDPFEYIVVPDFLKSDRFPEVLADYPEVPGPGSHPPAELSIRGHFKALIDELRGPEFQAAIERKFDIDLTGRPTMYTVRGFVREKDGSIHTDSETKIITVLLYMNERWQEDAGRLRLLALGRRSRGLRRRGAALWRHAAGLQALGQFLAWPQADLRSAPRDPAQLGDFAGRRRPRAAPPPVLDQIQEVQEHVRSEFGGVGPTKTRPRRIAAIGETL